LKQDIEKQAQALKLVTKINLNLSLKIDILHLSKVYTVQITVKSLNKSR